MSQEAGHDARAVANVILDRADYLGVGVSNMHINKIIYFAHGHFLAVRNKRLIDQPFEAWEYGPVVQDLYHRFKKFGKNPITERATVLDKRTGNLIVAKCNLTVDDSDFLVQIADFYSRIPAGRLSDMSHEKDGPWDKVWNYQGASNPGMFIVDSVIYDWFYRHRGGVISEV